MGIAGTSTLEFLCTVKVVNVMMWEAQGLLSMILLPVPTVYFLSKLSSLDLARI